MTIGHGLGDVEALAIVLDSQVDPATAVEMNRDVRCVPVRMAFVTASRTTRTSASWAADDTGVGGQIEHHCTFALGDLGRRVGEGGVERLICLPLQGADGAARLVKGPLRGGDEPPDGRLRCRTSIAAVRDDVRELLGESVVKVAGKPTTLFERPPARLR